MCWQGQVLEFNQVCTSASTYSVVIDINTSSGDKNSSDGSITNSDESGGDDGMEGPERPTKQAQKLPVCHYIHVVTTMFLGDIY